MLKFIGYILQLIMNPRRGWEDVEAENPVPRKLLLHALLPFIILTALTSFVRVFYFTDFTFVDAVQGAIINAVVYFATYFIASFIMTMKISALEGHDDAVKEDESTDHVEIFCSCIVGLLLLITLISNLIPLDLSLLQYLPLYSVYVIWKGADYLRIAPEKTGYFMILSVLTIVVPIYLLGYFFHLFT